MNQIDFNIDTVIDIIRSLNLSKAHGHDGISIRMIQLSLFLFTKKEINKNISNYRLICLLPIFSIIFERNESGFRPGDSCVHQLILITHDTHKNFDMNPSREFRGLFLGISKAFDRVWHRGLLYKIRNFGIDGNLLKLIE